MNKTTFLKTASVLLILLPGLGTSDEPTALQQIMQGLRDNLVEITDGLLIDDFDLVKRGAVAVAEHPQIPPDQVQLVAAELGAEMPAFKQFDVRVHDLALDIGRAAEALDHDAAVTAYQEMINGCFGCHVAYKDRVAAALTPSD